MVSNQAESPGPKSREVKPCRSRLVAFMHQENLSRIIINHKRNISLVQTPLVKNLKTFSFLAVLAVFKKTKNLNLVSFSITNK